MADTPQDLLANPDFQKLSPEAQHIVISKKFPEYANLSAEAQKIVLSKAVPPTAASGPPPLTKFPGTDIPVSPSRIPASMTGHPEEGLQMSDVGAIAPVAGSTIGGLLGGPPGAVLGGMAGSLGKQAAAGQETADVPGAALEGTTLGLAPEIGGKVAGTIGSKLEPMASQALARILRLSPKAFQFGREPAQEVLESGLAKGTLPEMAKSIGDASKQVTANLNGVLKSAPGTVNIESHAIDIANQLPGQAGNRFLQVVDDAAQKLGLRNNQLTSLTAEQANALKQEVAKQSRFIEGDLRPSVSNAGKVFGGRVKDELIKLAPEAESLLESSANLTEASKGADYAVRAEKAGQSKGLLGGVQVNKPATYARALTDTPTGARTVWNIAQTLKNSTTVSNALRIAFGLVYPDSGREATQ